MSSSETSALRKRRQLSISSSSDSSPGTSEVESESEIERPKKKVKTYDYVPDKSSIVFLSLKSVERQERYALPRQVAYQSPLLRQFFTEDLTRKSYDIQAQTTSGGVRLLTEWLYTAKLTIITCEHEMGLPEDVDYGIVEGFLDDQERDLVGAWTVAEDLCLPVLQNLIIDTLDTILRSAIYEGKFLNAAIKAAWRTDDEKSTILDFLVASWTHHDATYYHEHHKDLPKKFFILATIDLMGNRGEAFTPFDAKDYHVSTDS